MLHALVNTTALGLYLGSLGLRLTGRRRSARLLSLVGYGLVSLGGAEGRHAAEAEEIAGGVCGGSGQEEDRRRPHEP